MRKYFSLVVLALLGSMAASAQIGESKSKKIKTSITSVATATSEVENANYNRIFFGYAQTKVSCIGMGESLHGFNTGWLRGFNVIPEKKMPLYLEAGIALNTGFGEVGSSSDKLLSVEVPVNITYRYNIPNTRICLSPHFGFHFKVNVLARGYEKDEYLFDYYVNSESFSYFDDEEGRVKRFQMGIQLGANVDFNHFYVGIGWNKDFFPFAVELDYGESSLKAKTSGARVNIGFVF